MTLEETLTTIIRKVIREELANLKLTEPTPEPEVTEAPVRHEEKPSEEESSFLVEPESAVIVATTAELLAHLKATCGTKPKTAAACKAYVQRHGYDRISAIPDDEAQAMCDKLVAEVL